jgi:Subtilase family
MKWFFQPRSVSNEPERDDDDSSSGLIGLPAAVLQRHGARVLDPGKAAVVAQPRDEEREAPPPPRPTVYRARTLLIPDDLLQDAAFTDFFNVILARVNMMVVPPTPMTDPDPDPGRHDQRILEILRELRQLPRPAVLVPREDDPVPVVIDAWVALQTLRAAARPGRRQDLDETLLETLIERIGEFSLEHVLIGSAIMGAPADEGPGGLTGGSNNGSDGSGPTITDSYQFSGGDTRTPVTVLLDPPARRPTRDCERDYGRRPVVAVLDTGVLPHPWLEGDPAAPGGGYGAAADGFVMVDDKIQDAIREEGEHARARGDKPRQVIKNAWDRPDADDPLIGELNGALAHGTFIAGIVRQVTPDARVLAVRAMHSDDVCNEGDIICGLHHLAKRIALAEAGDLAAMVDVLSLSFGYFSESPHDVVVTAGLWKAIKVFLDLGVVVAAAAGNFAMSQEFYPAAFALETPAAGQVPVISVGALNPNGTKASFSNDGHWVTAWAWGAAVVSTYPPGIDGSRTPELRIPVNRKPPGRLPPGCEALDPDDYSGGFAVWSGTSFSAPYLAALVAGAMLAGAEHDASLKLGNAGPGAAADRVVAALAGLHAEEDRARLHEEEQGMKASSSE